MSQIDGRGDRQPLVSETIGFVVPIVVLVLVAGVVATVGIEDTALPLAVAGILIVLLGRWYLKDGIEVDRR